MGASLRDLVAEELSQPVDQRVRAMAEAIAGKDGKASRTVLFYGSCLREKQIDGLMLDFYLIVSNYREAYGRGWLALANRLIPPNVFYFEHGGLAAKYAVLSEADFHRLNGPETGSVSVWARFAQPSRLVWAANEQARQAAIGAVERAVPTLLGSAMPKGQPVVEPLELWRAAFALTYSAELRAERKGRSGSVVDSDPDRYLRFTGAGLELVEVDVALQEADPLAEAGKEIVFLQHVEVGVIAGLREHAFDDHVVGDRGADLGHGRGIGGEGSQGGRQLLIEDPPVDGRVIT